MGRFYCTWHAKSPAGKGVAIRRVGDANPRPYGFWSHEKIKSSTPGTLDRILRAAEEIERGR